MGRPFRTTARVRLSETDALGVVYFGQYLTYFDVSRMEMLRKVGITYQYLKRRKLGFVAGHVRCSYHSSARFDDLLSLEVWVARIGKTSVTYEHRIARGKTILAEGAVTDVLVGENGRPSSIQGELRRRLSKCQ
jgi:acyl-CoA thioester hydrolase